MTMTATDRFGRRALSSIVLLVLGSNLVHSDVLVVLPGVANEESADVSADDNNTITVSGDKLLHYQPCAPEDGGGVCPWGTSCCKVDDGHVTTSRCIVGVPGSVCCSDRVDEDGGGPMFCYSGYDCSDSGLSPTCTRNASKPQEEESARFGDVISQFSTCHVPPGTMEVVHGLPVPTALDPDGTNAADSSHRLAYFSTDGDLLTMPPKRAWEFQAAVVVVHGFRQSLTATGYFCPAVTAAKLQDYYPPESVLVIAPWFPTTQEPKIPLASGGEAMRWMRSDDLNGWPWGLHPHEPQSARNISSFESLDAIVNVLSDKRRFPHLDLITVVGNCNGAEFVQRWALLSTIPSWEHDQGDGVMHARIRTVVLNPTQLTYLSMKRYQDGKEIPKQKMRGKCRYAFDEYPFGLRSSYFYSLPYVTASLNRLDYSLPKIQQRYASRDVVHLSSDDFDIIPTTKHEPRDCKFQGATTVDVNRNFQMHLKDIFGKEVHPLLHVEGIAHEHARVFQTEKGLFALFGGNGMCPRIMPWVEPTSIILT